MMITEIVLNMTAIRQTFIYNLLKSIKTNRSDSVIFMRHNIIHDQVQTFADSTFIRALEYLSCPISEIKEEKSDLHRILFDVKRPTTINRVIFKCTANEHRIFVKELKKWQSILKGKSDRKVCERYMQLMDDTVSSNYMIEFKAGKIDMMRFVDFGIHTYLNVMLFNRILRTISLQWKLSEDGVLSGVIEYK